MRRINPAAIFVILTLCNRMGSCDLTIGELYKKDMMPTVTPIQTIAKKNQYVCGIDCSKTTSCFSFSFGNGDCKMWAAKYNVDDNDILQPKTGYIYYHLNVRPDATKYELHTTSATFDDALKTCQKKNKGNLMVIRDQKTFDEFGKLALNHELWFGLSGTVDLSSVDAFGRSNKLNYHWADGQVFSINQFHKFVPQDPNDGGKSCAVSRPDGNKPRLWIDRPCDVTYYFVCQYAP